MGRSKHLWQRQREDLNNHAYFRGVNKEGA